MSNQDVIRKLTTIVATDVAGYSRLMGADEEGTLAALMAHRRELIDPGIDAHRGRIVKTTGDGMLIEFASVVDAVTCCLEVQKGMAARNQEVPEDRRIEFRVGINLGDIIIDGDDIFGDGVNIAARLEAMAAPGGICISSAVFEQVQRKIQLETEDLGPRALKNIEDPVHAYRIAGVGGLETSDTASRASPSAVASDFKLPGRPSIAVLPFKNLTGNSEDDFIADGIALGIQTLMVQLSGLFLINAVSDQNYREGKSTAAEVVKDLPVRFVLEGTTQRGGDRVRVTVQLTDLTENAVVWAERYDRNMEDIFDLQDDITREVTSSLNVELFRRDLDRVLFCELAADGAWEYFLRGISYTYKFNPDDNIRAREMFEKLYAVRPGVSQGPGYISFTYWLEATRGWTDSPAAALKQAEEWAAKSIEYKDNDGFGHVIMSYIRLHERKYDEALALCIKADEYRGNCPAMLGQTSAVQLYCGDAPAAVKSARQALSVRTIFPPMLINLLATAYRDNGDLAQSISTAQEAMRHDVNFVDAMATLCTDYVLAGDNDEASRVAGEILAARPTFRISQFAAKHPYKDESKIAQLTDSLRAAGLPD